MDIRISSGEEVLEVKGVELESAQLHALIASWLEKHGFKTIQDYWDEAEKRMEGTR